MGQQKLIEALRRDLARGEVLAVVGTGVSIQASGADPRAGWDGLIRDGIDHCAGTSLLTDGEAAALRRDLDANDPDKRLEVAERIHELLAGGRLREWLQESVGKLPLEDREIIDAVHALRAQIATTNYDDLLSRNRRMTAVPWTNTAAVQEFIRRHRDAILHLHGYYDEPDSVILGVRSYQKLRDDHPAQAMQQVVAASRTLLFIGCGDGLSDPNFGALLEWSAEILADSKYRHYCLCRTSDTRTLKEKHPSLAFIEYGEKHSDLTPFLRSLAPPPVKGASLPAAGFCFGRSREVKELASALLKKKPLPVPILGGPGMGKTTISLTAIHDKRVAKRFGARRWFVRCDGVRTRGDLAAAIALAMGVPVTTHVEEEVLAELTSGPAALILDNAETPLDADGAPVEALLAILAAIESLALVATIRGQQRPPGVPWATTIEADRLSDKAAREAFVAAAGKKQFAADPHLPLLLGVLDGVPLAITLMARFAESFPSLDLVWKRWNAKRTAMLSNLEASYELSIEALSSAARRLLAVLAIFPDGVAYQDLAGIFPDPDFTAADELRARALVIDEEQRLRMLAPLREYVTAAHPPDAADEERAVSHYFIFVSQEGDRVGEAGGAESVNRLAPEVANMEALFVRVQENWQPYLPAAMRGWTEFMRLTGLGSTAPIEQLRQRAFALELATPAARFTHYLAEIMLARSELAAARLFEEALQLYRKIHDRKREAACIMRLGNIAYLQADDNRAQEHFELALTLYEKYGDPAGRADGIIGLGELALRRYDYATAQEKFEEALRLYQGEAGSPLGAGNCLLRLGQLALVRSDHAAARLQFDDALMLFRDVGSLLGVADCLMSLGETARLQSDYETAREYAESALPVFRSARSRIGEANCLWTLGDIAGDTGNADQAIRRYREALALFEQIPEPYSIGWLHRMLARLEKGSARTAHGTAARNAWKSIRRDDLVRELDKELGG